MKNAFMANTIPRISISFILSKNDAEDFEHNRVTQCLGIIPTEFEGPHISKGKIISDFPKEESSNLLKSITVIPSNEPPYQFVKHAFWCVDFQEISTWSLDDAWLQIEKVLYGKEKVIQEVCEEYNLNASLLVRIFSEAYYIPEISFTKEKLSFLSSIGSDLEFDFCLD